MCMQVGALDTFNFDNTWGKRALRLVLHGLYEGVSTHPAILEACRAPHYGLLVGALDAIGARPSRTSAPARC